MVLRANKNSNVGGHIASFASAATLYDVGYNHFWHAASNSHGGDLIFAQGHSSPGLYAYAFLLGELTQERLGVAAVGVLHPVAAQDEHGQLGQVVTGQEVQFAAGQHLLHGREAITVEAGAVPDPNR